MINPFSLIVHENYIVRWKDTAKEKCVHKPTLKMNKCYYLVGVPMEVSTYRDLHGVPHLQENFTIHYERACIP